METFVIISTITNQETANQSCALLEDAGIAVMLEHLELSFDDGVTGRAFRLLVPQRDNMRAQRIISGLVSVMHSPAEESLYSLSQ
jgi:hypothetical protein